MTAGKTPANNCRLVSIVIAWSTILVKNLETLVSISPSPMLIWVSQWSQCFKIRVAQHWGGRRHISGGKTVWSRNLMIVPENSRETVSVSTICDEYCRFFAVGKSKKESDQNFFFFFSFFEKKGKTSWDKRMAWSQASQCGAFVIKRLPRWRSLLS